MVERIVLVRHGETEWTRTARHTGRTDVALTDEGRRQAAAAGTRLAGVPWSLVLTSPLSRAIETCRLAGLGGRCVLDDDLREWDYGEYDGLSTAAIRERDPAWSLWTDGCPGGENAADVARRADRVIERCRVVEGSVALFAHGHLLRVLGARWIGADPTFGAHLLLSTASISALGWERDTAAIAEWNDTSHLTRV
jgi:broad specificity phosphatase PhoE